MQRRLVLSFTAALGVGAAGCAGLPGVPDQYKLTAQRLSDALAARLPLRHTLAGLLNLDLRASRLRMIPEQNRIGAEVLMDATAPALGRSYSGGFDLAFGLRYEPADQTIRAHQIDVLGLRLPGIPGSAAQAVQSALPGLSRQLLGDVVLHQVQPQALQVAAALGLQPQGLTVVPDGVVVQFAPTGRR